MLNSFLRFFRPKREEKTLQEDNFDEAKSKLREAVEKTCKEVDAFGEMVRDMKGLPPIARKKSKAKAASKTKPKAKTKRANGAKT